MAQRSSEQDGLVAPKATPARAPARAGVTLKARQFDDVLSNDDLAAHWFEVQPEDFMSDAASEQARERLDQVRARFPLSLHGVALGVGVERDLDPRHLEQLKALVDRYDPCLVSEHLAWSTHGAPERLETLPPPYDETTLDRASRHIEQTQEALGRTLLLENPYSYIRLSNSTMEETGFLRAIVARTGCKLLLDVNNAFISAANNRASAQEYLDAFPVEAVGEIHISGHAELLDAEGQPVLRESRDSETPEVVWALYERLVGKIGPRPTLIEWNVENPDWARLQQEAARVNGVLDRVAGAI